MITILLVLPLENVHAQCPTLPDPTTYGFNIVPGSDLLANCEPLPMSIQLATQNPLVCEDDPVPITVELYFFASNGTHFTIIDDPNGFSFISTGFLVPGENFPYDKYEADLVVPGLNAGGLLDIDLTLLTDTPVGLFKDLYFRVVLPDGTASGFTAFDDIESERFEYTVGGAGDPPGTQILLTDIDGGQSAGEMLTPQESQNGGQDVLIYNTLVVNEDYWITHDSKFALWENASIIVESGSTLTIEKEPQFSVPPIIRGCLDMWDRILVQDGASLVISEVTVKDGESGIQLDGEAHLSLTSTNLLNNYRSITTPSSGGSRKPFIEVHGQNTITTDGAMLPPYEGQKPGWGIFFLNADFNLLGDAANTITFSGLQRGMDLRFCNATVEKMVFRNIEQFGVQAKGYGTNRFLTYKGFGPGSFGFDNMATGITANDMNLDISNTSMRQLNTGIEVSHSDRRNIDIYDNQVTARRTGIGLFANMPTRLQVSDNDITVDDDTNTTGSATGIGIRAEENTTGSYLPYRLLNNLVKVDNAQTGIWVQSGLAPRITKNTVNLLDPDRETYFGIDVQGSHIPIALCNAVNGNGSAADWNSAVGFNADGLSDARIRCNSVADSDVGFNFDNLGDATDLTGNNINDHRLGLQVTSGAYIGDQKHAGNQWLGVTAYGGQGNNYQPINGNFGGFNQSNPTFSRFFVDQGENPLFNTSVNVSNWFLNNPSTTSSYSCTTSNTCPNGIGSDIDEFTGETPKGIDVLDYTIANGGLAPGTCDSEVNWTGKRRLYQRLMDEPSLYASDTAMQSFVNAASLTTVGQFHSIEASIAALFVADAATEAQLAAQQANIEAELKAIYAIDSTLAAGGLTQSQIDSLMLQKSAHQAILDAEMASNDALVGTVVSDRAAQAVVLEATNAAIAAATVPEVNEQTVNDIFLETVAVGVDTFNVSQASSLLATAQQCPPCGGDAVYRARAMYALVDQSADFSSMGCGVGGRSANTPDAGAKEGPGFILTPNPAVDEVLIELEGAVSDTPMELAVYSTTGRLMKKLVLPPNMPKHRIDTSTFPAGAYYIVVFDNGNQLYTGQLFITR